MTIHLPILKNIFKRQFSPTYLTIILIVFSFTLRLLSLDYLDASDNYNDIAYKNIFENGGSCYNYSTISTYFTLFFIKYFGFNFFSLRMPSLIYSLITVIFVYFIARRINKHAAMISVFLFAVSPWSIVLSRVTRDYAFDCMLSSVLIFITVLTIKEIFRKTGLQLFINSIILTITILIIFLLTKFNQRSQTLLVVISPLVGILFNVYYLLPKIVKGKWKVILISSLAVGVGVLFFYYIDYANFKKGFLFNGYYFRIFFTPWLESPWQWFHGNNIVKSTALLFAFFLIPLIFKVLYEKKDINYFLFLYIAFFIGVAIFFFKFKSHINYNPTRYVYFLFPIYAIIYSFSFYYLSMKISKNKFYRTIVFFLLFGLFFNLKSFCYAVYPELAYKNDNISTLDVDNIGVGRFKMNDVCKFLKKETGWNSEKPYVFGGRYGEFILLLDYKMDSDRCLLMETAEGIRKYDVGKNMYVESSYFGYHELESAVNQHSAGYLVTDASLITDSEENEIIKLQDDNFILYGSKFIFVKNINDYRIYAWESAGNIPIK
jgi:hypothetical protein